MLIRHRLSIKGMGPQGIQAVVAAWQAGAISRQRMTDIFRRGEVLPEGRSVEEEIAAIKPAGEVKGPPAKTVTEM